VIYVCEHHDEALTHWRSVDLRGIALVHVDFHDDLRGLLVDRRRRVAYPIGKLARGPVAVDSGNFLAHAVLEGRLRRLRWIHGTIGGRAWDAGIVRYETDLFAVHHRLRQRARRAPEVPFEFDETLLQDWDGPGRGDLLSVDWDCFASTLMDTDGIDSRVDAFFDRLGPGAPRDTWVAYSPEYSHPTLQRFKTFVETLGRRLAQQLEWLSAGLLEDRLSPTGVCTRLPRDPLTRFALLLRRKGIY
jgi:hypothetical protein